MATKIGTWFHASVKLDPWSYENVLMVQKAIHAKTESAAIRYILRRAKKTLPRK